MLGLGPGQLVRDPPQTGSASRVLWPARGSWAPRVVGGSGESLNFDEPLIFFLRQGGRRDRDVAAALPDLVRLLTFCMRRQRSLVRSLRRSREMIRPV